MGPANGQSGITGNHQAAFDQNLYAGAIVDGTFYAFKIGGYSGYNKLVISLNHYFCGRRRIHSDRKIQSPIFVRCNPADNHLIRKRRDHPGFVGYVINHVS